MAAALDEVRTELFGTLLVLAQNLGRVADAELRRFDLTSRQWLLLAVLAKAFGDRPPTLAEAAAAYGSSRQNVAQIARQLTARGFLRIEPDAADRRAVRLVVTERVAVFDEPAVRDHQLRLLADLFGVLPPDDLTALRGLAVRLLTGLSRSPS